MAHTLTTELSLVKPTTGTHEPYSITNENANLDTLDALFNTSTGHDHSGAHKGAPVTRGAGMTVTGGLTVSTGALTVTASDATARRLKAAGTAVVNGDVTPNSSWGSTATASVAAGSTDQRGSVTITAGGSGIMGNPIVTFIFHDGSWTTAPFALVTLTGGSGAGETISGVNVTPTSTQLQFQPFFTAITGHTYIFTWLCIG